MLLDFWRWSVSDILSNATRGRFAEFIVATATNINKSVVRDEWSAYDLETPDGIKLEIKSSAFLQSWAQKALSDIKFSVRPAREWDNLTNKYSPESKRHADVYVFCLLHHDNKLTVDPLNMNHWEFYVMATKELPKQSSITLKLLKRLTKSVTYDSLYESIREKYKRNEIV